MTLFYLNLELNYDEYKRNENELRYGFQLNTRFISNYFSKEIRKIRFKTDGTFNMISISLTESEPGSCKINYPEVLEVQLPFDRSEYLKIKGKSDYNYYLELFKEGFKKASEFKNIPLEELNHIIKVFKEGNCRNEWIELKKKFKDDDIEVILKSEFTTNYYQIIAIINQISTKKELVRGTIIRTEPNEIIFETLTKYIEIDKDIFIKNKFNEPVVEINKEDALNGKLSFKILREESKKDMLTYMI